MARSDDGWMTAVEEIPGRQRRARFRGIRPMAATGTCCIRGGVAAAFGAHAGSQIVLRAQQLADRYATSAFIVSMFAR